MHETQSCSESCVFSFSNPILLLLLILYCVTSLEIKRICDRKIMREEKMIRWPTRAILSWIHNNLSWYKTIFHGTQQSFVMQNNFSRNTTIFRNAKQFFTEHNNLSWCKIIFHGTQQSFVIQNNFSRHTTIFRDAKQFFMEKNNVAPQFSQNMAAKSTRFYEFARARYQSSKCLLWIAKFNFAS